MPQMWANPTVRTSATTRPRGRFYEVEWNSDCGISFKIRVPADLQARTATHRSPSPPPRHEASRSPPVTLLGHPSVTVPDEVPALADEIDGRGHHAEQDDDAAEALGESIERGTPVESIGAVCPLSSLAHLLPAGRHQLHARTGTLGAEPNLDQLRVRFLERWMKGERDAIRGIERRHLPPEHPRAVVVLLV